MRVFAPRTTQLAALPLLWAVLGLVAGCATPQTPEPYPPAVFEHRVADGRVELYWSCSEPEPGILQIEGAARSPGSGEVRFMEIEAVGVDARGRTVGSVRVPVRDVVMHTNAWAPFYLITKTTGGEARVDLYYQYYHPAESDDGFRFGLGGRQFQRSFVRDACSPSQHRAG